MNIKRYMYIMLIFLVLLSVSAVSAADDSATDIISANANEELILDESINDDVSSANDDNDELILEENSADNKILTEEANTNSKETNTDVLSADSSTYSELKSEIGSGGTVTLQHKYYTYDSESTITISTDNSVIDGNGSTIDMEGSNIRAFYVSASGVIIKNLTIINANYDGDGAAIYFSGSGTVENCNFTNNSAKYGSAVYFLDNGNVTNCNFTDNKATGDDSYGGAIWMYSGTVENCNFTDNKATGEYGRGGAIYFSSSSSTSTVTNCNFTNNSAKYGGAVYFLDNGNVTNCNFTKNTASEQGGAIRMRLGTVENCNFTNNKAGSKGGAILFSNKGTVTVCNFDSNSASSGGAIFSWGWATNAYTCILKTDSDRNDNENTVFIPPTLAVEDFTTVYGSGEKLSFELNTSSNVPIYDANILISVYFKNDDSFVGNYSCLSGEEWAVDLPVGSYYAIYNTEYGGFEPINKTITITVPAVQYYINVTSVTSNNKTVNITAESNIPENLFWGGKLLFILPNSAEISVNYGADNTWWAVYTFEDAGDYNVTASYIGLDNVIVNNATISIRLDASVDVNYKSLDLLIGDTFTIVATTTPEGLPVSYVPDDSGVYSIDENGKVTALKEGKGSILIKVGGDGIYAENSTIVNVTVSKIPTEITANDITASYNINKDLVITLKDSAGKAIRGVKLTVDLNGAKEYTTDSNGQVKVSTKGLAPNVYTVKISFAGNKNYVEYNTTAKVTVQKATPKITAKAKTFKYEDKTKKYTITLKDNKGTVMKNTKVTLKVNGKTYTATTNSKGVATFKLAKLTKKGSYNAVITYAGDKYYNKISKKAKITVKAPAWKTVAKGSKDKATVKKIQKALKKNGYYLSYKGRYLKVDGIFHKYTQMAVKQFQKAKGLKVTGKVDYATAKKLKIV